jgi:hypothetical protein
LRSSLICQRNNLANECRREQPVFRFEVFAENLRCSLKADNLRLNSRRTIRLQPQPHPASRVALFLIKLLLRSCNLTVDQSDCSVEALHRRFKSREEGSCEMRNQQKNRWDGRCRPELEFRTASLVRDFITVHTFGGRGSPSL